MITEEYIYSDTILRYAKEKKFRIVKYLAETCLYDKKFLLLASWRCERTKLKSFRFDEVEPAKYLINIILKCDLIICWDIWRHYYDYNSAK